MDVYLKAARLPKGMALGGEAKSKPFDDEPDDNPAPAPKVAASKAR